MAKKVGISLQKKWQNRINFYVKKVDQLYLSAIREAATIGASITNYDASRPFAWSDYPQTKARVDKLINSLYSNLVLTIDEATQKEWLAACAENDRIVRSYFKKIPLLKVGVGELQSLFDKKERMFEGYTNRNIEALKAFQIRKTNGLNLSQRIWNYTEQFRNELEMCLDIGLYEGRSADELSRDIRKYLNEPDRLYRRIKNKESGHFYLSKNAKKYNPRPGVYRSSYKNTLRVTRTETNMAYRASDIERWSQMDFVIGYEVRRSNNVFSCMVCEALAGKYPKSFKFYGWHPQCRCFIVPILAAPEEFIANQKRILSENDKPTISYQNEIKELPDNFKIWVKDNSNKIATAKSIPYFLRDNFSSNNISKGLLTVFI